MTTKEFRVSQFRDQLFAFLNTDCAKAAISLLEKKPALLPSINGIHHTDTVVARMYASDAGANGVLQALKNLAEPWVDETEIATASARAEWSDYLPPEIKAAYEKQMNINQQS